jgi:hypothetical protein
MGFRIASILLFCLCSMMTAEWIHAGAQWDPALPSCPDADGDGVQSCLPGSLCEPTGPCGDCDDTEAAVSPSAVESCNGIDDNCTGDVDESFLDQDADTRADCVDCDPLDISTWAPPGFTHGVHFSDRQFVSWDHVPFATLANVYRGSRTAGAPWDYNQQCVATGVVGNAAYLPEDPVPGELYFYLIEGMNSCGQVGFLDATDGPRPIGDDSCEYSPRDQDGDGLDDLDDNCPRVGNADQADADLDGFGDVCDSCLSVFNPDQVVCSGRGQCVADEIPGATQCLCDPGFAGEDCEAALPGSLAAFADLPEPTRWEVDGQTGRRYRRATLDERRRFAWMPGTYLVESPGVSADVSLGAPTTVLLVPIGDGSAQPVVLDLANPGAPEGQVIQVASFRGQVFRGADRPVFFDYLSRPPADEPLTGLLKLSAVSDGGSLLTGRVGDYELRGYTPLPPLDITDPPTISQPRTPIDPATLVPITLLQPSPESQANWDGCFGEGYCDAFCDNLGIDAPCDSELGGNPCCRPYDPNPAPATDCYDNYDNDGDGFVDADGDGVGAPVDSSCLHSNLCSGLPAHEHRYESGKQFILQGDIHLCSHLVWEQHRDWRVEFRDRASKIVHSGFELLTGYGPYDQLAQGDDQVMRWVAIKCWIAADVETARACKNDGAYDCSPFVGHDAYPYAGSGDVAQNYMGEPARLDLVHAVDVGLGDPVNLVHVVMATDQGDSLQSTSGNAVEGASDGVYSVAKWSDTYAVEHWSVSVHELGHSLGLTHCDATLSAIDGDCTVMGSPQNTGGGSCALSTICDREPGYSRFGTPAAQILFQAVRDGLTLPYFFGN